MVIVNFEIGNKEFEVRSIRESGYPPTNNERGYQFSKELDDKWDELDRMTYGDLQISQCENLRDWNYINECNHNFRFEFTYVHELQHLLYALHIDSNLKI